MKAEDIYTAAGWESMYQNGYLHGSPSRFSAKSAIYTAAGCQHKIAIYTAAVPERIQIYTPLPCVHTKSLFTRQPFKSQIGYIYGCQVYKNRYLHGSRSKAKSAIYIAAVRLHKTVICTAAIQEPNRLYTLLSMGDSAHLRLYFVYINNNEIWQSCIKYEIYRTTVV